MQVEMMNAMMTKQYGGPEVLQMQKVEKPQVQSGELLIRVKASAATAADTILRKGKPYFSRLFVGLRKPKHPIPGTGFAGVIEEVGSNAGAFAPGDRVFGETLFGFSANADFVKVHKDGVVLPMTESMTFAEAATYCDGPLTSLNFLQEIAGIQAGDRVLVNGAAGSLGTAAVQLAKYFGAEVTAVCSTRNVGLMRSLGADHVIDYTREDFSRHKKTFDIVYDTIGKSSFATARPSLRENGQYITPVFSAGLLCPMLMHRGRVKFAATGMKKPQELRELLGQLVDIQREGKLKVHIDRQYPLEKLSEAHRLIDSGHKRGNVVIQHIN